MTKLKKMNSLNGTAENAFLQYNLPFGMNFDEICTDFLGGIGICTENKININHKSVYSVIVVHGNGVEPGPARAFMQQILG
jgi:hypothetical protein